MWKPYPHFFLHILRDELKQWISATNSKAISIALPAYAFGRFISITLKKCTDKLRKFFYDQESRATLQNLTGKGDYSRIGRSLVICYVSALNIRSTKLSKHIYRTIVSWTSSLNNVMRDEVLRKTARTFLAPSYFFFFAAVVDWFSPRCPLSGPVIW